MLARLYCSRYHTAERSLFRARHLTSPAAPTAAGPLQLTPSSWGDSAPSLGTAVVSLHHDTWLGHGFFSQASCPASMCHGGFAACSGFPNPSQVDLSSRVSPSPLTRAPTVGNSLTTGTGSQAAFSTERFHPKPGSTLQFHTLKAQSNPKAEMDATAATLGLRCHAAAFHLLSQGTVLSACQRCAASVSCILKASALPLASRPPGGREERLGEGLPAQAPDCTHLRGLLPCLVSTKGRIFLPPGAEKKPSAFHLLTVRCTQVEEWGLSLPKGQAVLPPRSQMHRHSPGTHQSLLAC